MIKAPKIHTDLLWDLSILFVGLAVVYFICVFFYRNRISARAGREKQRKRELSPMVSEFLFYDDEASKDEKSNYVNLKIEIRQLLKDDFNRKILSEVLLDLRKDLAGDTQKRLFKLYQDLGLHNDAFEQLKSWRWERVSKAIRDLTQMQVAEAYTFATKFINDKRPTIRKQAEIAVVTLKPEGINYFLDTTKYKISEWQQLKLLDVLRNEEDYQPPRFKAWLTSTNRHVVLFALRLIKFYNQNDADAALIELVKHKNSQIKAEAIGCITEFYIVAALPTLKLVFWKSSTDIKIAILGAIGSLGKESDIEFLQLIEKKEANFSVRSKAHSSINAIMPDSIMPSKGLMKSTNYSIPDDIVLKDEDEDIAEEKITEPIAVEPEVKLAEPIIVEIEEKATAEIEVEAEEVDADSHSPKENQEEAIIKPEEAIHTEIKPEVMKENQMPTNEEKSEPQIEAGDSVADETLSFDFLPLVVQAADEAKMTATDEEDMTVEPKGVVVVYEEVTPQEGASEIELNEMTVKYEEVVPEDDANIHTKEVTFEIKEEELAFLPIVTDFIEESPLEKNTQDQPKDVFLLQDIEVQFEEVQITIQKPSKVLAPDFSEFSTPEILETQVIYDIVDAPVDKISDKHINDLTDPYFLSNLSESPQEDTMDTESNVNLKSLQSYNDMEPQDEQKFKKIIKDLIDFNEQKQAKKTSKSVKDWPLLQFGDEFVDTSSVSQVDEPVQDESAIEAHAEDEDRVQEEVIVTTPNIPNAMLGDEILDEIVLYKENTEESRMQLLDDIAEMGDYRELPLLNELLVNEKYKTVKDRVKRLIEQFNEGDEQPKQDVQLKPFNVFEDLFRTCDTEAKLILMDEIVAVGDAAEIDFLEGLLEDEEKEISNKAARILEELKAKLALANQNENRELASTDNDQAEVAEMEVLIEEETLAEYDSLMEELQIQPPQTSGIFDLSFELTEPLTAMTNGSRVADKPAEQTVHQESILGQLYAKIIDKLNG
ncbi:MAG: hypothetical protein ABJN95_12135 [Maribacter sp.]|uniref:HEAT repeat domain-containing protein n=1 Tax=Maribacter sp. TaxID=1897614 RepID=UPI00329868ED